MIEKILFLEGIDPLEFFGINNQKFDKLKACFPKLKLIGRGDEIKAIGDESEILRFEEKLSELVAHINKYNFLNNGDFERILFDQQGQNPPDPMDVLVFGNNGKPIKAITPNQRIMVEKYRTNDLLFAVGPAGSGKTYTAIALAVRALKNREIKRIILSRPAVEAGENLGFLPGDLKDKIDPYLQPLYDALNDMIPVKKLNDLIEDKVIQIAPLGFMRGRTLDHSCVILDEAQNATVAQFKMFLTRMGMSSKFIVTGDITQIDLPRKQMSGLVQALRILSGIEGIASIIFDNQDITRHRLVKQIVNAYEAAGNSDSGEYPLMAGSPSPSMNHSNNSNTHE